MNDHDVTCDVTCDVCSHKMTTAVSKRQSDFIDHFEILMLNCRWLGFSAKASFGSNIILEENVLFFDISCSLMVLWVAR